MGRGRSLRGALTALTIVLATLSLFVVAALAILSDRLQHVTASMTAAMQGTQLVEDAEIALLLHARAADPVIRRRLAAELVDALSAARRHVVSSDEAELLARAQASAAAYLAEPSREPMEATFQLIDRLVAQNAEQARQARRAAARWEALGVWLAAAAAIALVAVTIGAAWWLRARAFRPILALSSTVARFARGERDARAPESGAAELAEIGRRFNELADTLEAQRAARVTLLGRVAHDLKNPISALKLGATLLDKHDAPADEARVRRFVGVVTRQVTRLERMIGDLLDSASLEAGRLELKLGEYDLRAVVRDACAPFEESSPAHRLELALPDAEVRARCDAMRVEQVIGNLLSNAIKYSPSGGAVRVSLAAADGTAVIAVSDEGIGIADADRATLFDPFRRVGLSRERIPGVGLGLHGVRKIVEAHGGTIEVESRLGEGSTFRVRLPLAS